MPLTTSAPTTAPQRLVTPPITSIASVRNVSSRYTCSVVIEPRKCTSSPPAKPDSAPESANAHSR